MSREMREQINKVKNFGQFLNEGKREKIFLNGYEMWLDRDKLMLYDKEYSQHGIGLHRCCYSQLILKR